MFDPKKVRLIDGFSLTYSPVSGMMEIAGTPEEIRDATLDTIDGPTIGDGGTLRDGTMPNIWCAEPHPKPTTELQWVDALAGELIAERVHEVAEWLAVDGQRFADPHPPSQAMFVDLGASCRRLWQRYRRQYPGERMDR